MFEVTDLKYATVSRCGMVWFSKDVLSAEMIFNNYLVKLKQILLRAKMKVLTWVVMESRERGRDLPNPPGPE